MIVKTLEEIEILREGGRRLGSHVKELCAMVAPGVTLVDIDRKARELIAAGGDQSAFLHYPSGLGGEKFPGVVCLSVNDTIVHAPGAIIDYTIKEGDVVTVDFGIVHRGLFTDHAVTVIAGKGSEADIRLVRGTEEALAAGIKQARVGNTIGDIGLAVQTVAEKYNFGFPKNLAGHGVGKAVHENPLVPNFVTAGKSEKLVEGLVIAIEPMMTLGSGDLYVDKDKFSYITRDHSRTAHSEHTVLITKSGPEILTKV
ncbi:MAG: methionine aminopeptidase methionyl aminopeptidase [Candidatus Kaiserbacteria bacterium]|nr:methionine aminopeptidase methionyl aminopeptidase [Candidatus Kaiserbacteria bacterium]